MEEVVVVIDGDVGGAEGKILGVAHIEGTGAL